MNERIRARAQKRRTRNRQGSALLLCTLAAAVLSMAGIAILRSTQQGIARVAAQRSVRQGRAVSEGLLQRSLAILRVNSNIAGTITDPSGDTSAHAMILPRSPTAIQIQVFLYPGSTTPVKDIVLDPRNL